MIMIVFRINHHLYSILECVRMVQVILTQHYAIGEHHNSTTQRANINQLYKYTRLENTGSCTLPLQLNL